ncbi:MAG: DNA methyltransferase, partial [Pseudomonadales bacterium]
MNQLFPEPNMTTDYEPGKVWAEDCREYMQRMADDSVSLILTDPPYFMDGMDEGWDNEKLRRKVCSNGVVSSLPAGMKFDRNQGTRLQEFLSPVAAEWMRIIRPGGFVLCFSQNRLVHHAAMAIEAAGFEIRDILAWRYEGQAKAFSQDHFIAKRNIPAREKKRLLAKLGGRKTPQLKPQCELMVLGQAPRDGTFVDNWDRWETGLIDTNDPLLDPGRFPGTVVEAPKPKNRHG